MLVCLRNVFYCTSTHPGTIPQRSTDLLTPVKVNSQFSGGIISVIEQRKSEESNFLLKEKDDGLKKTPLVNDFSKCFRGDIFLIQVSNM